MTIIWFDENEFYELFLMQSTSVSSCDNIIPADYLATNNHIIGLALTPGCQVMIDGHCCLIRYGTSTFSCKCNQHWLHSTSRYLESCGLWYYFVTSRPRKFMEVTRVDYRYVV